MMLVCLVGISFLTDYDTPVCKAFPGCFNCFDDTHLIALRNSNANGAADKRVVWQLLTLVAGRKTHSKVVYIAATN
jgi:hypothetical protein